MKTIEEVLELAEKLNELTFTNGYISVKVEGLDAKEIKALSDQENWCSLKLGEVDFILSSRKIEKVKPIF
jgi:hypothetical protein